MIPSMTTTCCRLEGEGIMSHRDGHIFDGKFENWRKHGEGKMTYRNGDIYTGVWDGDKGTGTIAYTDGSSYEVQPHPCHQCPGRVSERQKGWGRHLQIAQWKYIHWNIQGELRYPFCLFIVSLISSSQNDLENGNGTFIWTDGYKYTVSHKSP